MAAVRYFVHDVEASAAFYSQHFGFEVTRKVPAIAILSRKGLTLWLAGPTSSAARPMPDGRVPEPGGWNRFAIEVDDLAAEIARLKKEGVPFRNTMVEGPGGRQILCEDPSGNVIELFEAR